MIILDLFSFFQGHMIILDLFSEVKPMYQNFESFYGQPFIWNMLHNFGGTIAMYGAIESIHTVSSNKKCTTPVNIKMVLGEPLNLKEPHETV